MIVTYEIDARDDIVAVGGEWDAFAFANSAPELANERVVGRSLWDYIADLPALGLYRLIVDRARLGQNANLDFRCDSPDRRRFMRMEVHSSGEGTVRFACTAQREEGREGQPLLDRASPRTDKLVTICGWCKMLQLSTGAWLELEAALTIEPLLAREPVPGLSHGICPACEALVRGGR